MDVGSNRFDNVPHDLLWAASSEFVSSSIPSWQIVTAHAQPFRGARDLAFCLKVPLDLLLVWASSRGSGETARMPRLAWTFVARLGDKYQIPLTRPLWCKTEFQQYTQCIIYLKSVIEKSVTLVLMFFHKYAISVCSSLELYKTW